MKKKYKIIKEKKQSCYAKIKECNEHLDNLRKECDHPEEFIETVDYQWAPGHITTNTKICGICGDTLPGQWAGEITWEQIESTNND